MVRHWQYILCGALLLGIACQNPVAAQGVSSASSPVEVYFTAAGKGETPPVTTLSQLSASIDKQPTQVTSLRSAAGDKLLFALLVDISGSDNRVGADVKQAALQIFQGLLAEGNEGHLVVFNTQIQMSEKPVQLSEVQSKLDSVQFRGRTALFDAIGETCAKILSRAGNPGFPRRAIFLISDGGDNASRIGLAKAEKIAEEQGVAIFFLAVAPDPYAATPEEREGAHTTAHLAEFTGGQTLLPERLEDGVQPLLNAVHRQWVVDLLPTQAPDQKLHSLTIKSSQKNLRLSVPAHIFLP
jgi:hypothetical protein